MILKYEIEKKTFGELKDKIEIPRFQRGLVWGKQKKREFIKTLKSGLPIGVLLLSQKDDKYLVIDGLQRFTTMEDYAKDYFSYIDREEISDIDVMDIILSSDSARSLYDDSISSAQERIREEIRAIVIESISNGQGKNLFVISKNAAEKICKNIAVFPDGDFNDIQGRVYAVVERISNQAKIDDITIPLIIFKGSEDELADIFQKLNQEGVKLSKYDVFAATWINHTVQVLNDSKFINYIIGKYDAAQKESNLDIADYDPEAMKKTGILTVFEYAFAVGKALMDECPRLFPKFDDAKIDSIGFLLLAEIMGLTYQNMGRLAKVIDEYEGVNYKELKDAIVDAGKIVENALIPYIDAPTTGKGKKTSLVCHSELQLASYIIVIFKLKYIVSKADGVSIRSKYSKDVNLVKQYLYKHYLFDIISGYWAGSGDSKLEAIIQDPQTCKYTRDVDRNSFELAISNWLDSSNDKVNSANVSADTKLFLNYLLRARVHDADKTQYDIEHCVPKNVIQQYFIKKNITVPISSVCNLVYIPASENRSKGDLTYYQKQAGDPGTYQLSEEQLDTLTYPTRSELLFVESVEQLTEDNYFRFLEQRKNLLQNVMMKELYKD